MAKTVVGLFDRFEDAQSVVQDLTDRGFSRDDISLVANDAEGRYADMGGSGTRKMDDTTAEQAGSGAVGGTVAGGIVGLLVGIGALAIPGIGPVLAAGPLAAALGSTALGAGIGAASGALVGPLVDAGIPDPDANFYAEGVRRGGTLVMVRTSDDMADDAADIMQRYNVVDIDQRMGDYQTSGWSRFDETSQPYSSTDIDSFRTTVSNRTVDTTPIATGTTETSTRSIDQGSEVLPVIEEQLQVGKRQVQRGGVRIHSHVTERPVEEQVRLREETVNVERRPVDRPISDSDMNAFKETTLEVTTTSEEAVVAKQARVVEEVIVDKDVTERTETIRDTVRRTDVEVDQVEGSNQTIRTDANLVTSTVDYDVFDADFRNDYQTRYSNMGGSYDQYSPVYRYGYNLGTDTRYSSGDWSTVEPEARRRWEERNPGTWDQFKDSVRYAWDRARNRK